MVPLLALFALYSLSTASSIVTHGHGISQDEAATTDQTYIPGVLFDRFYQVWLENIVKCSQLFCQSTLSADNIQELRRCRQER